MTNIAEYAVYTVDLGNLQESKACFNNGFGNWDSNNGNNYTLKKGYDVYIENGNVRYVERGDIGTTREIRFNDSAYSSSGAYISWEQKVYAYVWTTPSDYAVFAPTQDIESWSKNAWGTWCRHDTFVFDIPTRYTHILFKNSNDTTTWDKQTVDYDMPQDENNYFIKTDVNGEGKYVGEWTTSGIPVVTATPVVSETPIVTATPIVSATPTATPTATPYVEKNVAVVYYTGSDKAGSKKWTSKCFIHFKVNGVWTTAPGVQMKAVDASKAQYVYTIDLGNTTEATVCFNNGSGSWDSNSGKNYVVKAGVNYVEGLKVTHSDEPVKTNTTIVYNNDSDFTWTNVYAYAWNSTTDFEIFYPTKTYGSKSVIGKDGKPVDVYTYYQFDIPVTYANVLFKNIGNTNEWDAQTQDLVMPNTDNSCFIVDGKDWEGKLYGHWDIVSQETLASCVDMPKSEEAVVATGSALVEDIAA